MAEVLAAMYLDRVEEVGEVVGPAFSLHHLPAMLWHIQAWRVAKDSFLQDLVFPAEGFLALRGKEASALCQFALPPTIASLEPPCAVLLALSAP